MPVPNRIAWWHFGLVGGMTLSLVTLGKAIAALPGWFAEKSPWSEFFFLMLAVLGMGFVCGCVVWLLRGFSVRFGAIGDAAIGVVVMNVFFLGCMLCYDRKMLTGEASGREAMLVLATLIGLGAGPWFGRDLRRELGQGEGVEAD